MPIMGLEVIMERAMEVTEVDQQVHMVELALVELMGDD